MSIKKMPTHFLFDGGWKVGREKGKREEGGGKMDDRRKEETKKE